MTHPGRNIKLVIEYDGTDFSGWQVQPETRTVQGAIEDTAARILGHPVRLTAAGRTDAGVHARGQTANFHTTSDMPAGRLRHALNGTLPRDITIMEAADVPAAFNARFDARARTYRYTISDRRFSIGRNYVWRVKYPLSRELITEAARSLRGELNIRGFSRGADDDDYSTLIFDAGWRFDGHVAMFDISAIRFFHHAVRSMVGTMIEIGRGRCGPATVARILESRDRSLAGPTAPARGLCLMNVDYGEEQ